MKHLAAIDIGSNATRLLVKQIDDPSLPYDPQVHPATDKFVRFPIRLGVDVYGQGAISVEKEKELVEAFRHFNLVMAVHKVTRCRACATAAFRAASNADEVVSRIYDATGIHIEIISGEEEAGLVRNSYLAQHTQNANNILYADVGGGSSDVCLTVKGETRFIHSYPIGSMRQYSKEQADEILAEMHKDLGVLAQSYGPLHLVGAGGSIHKIGKIFSPEMSQGLVTLQSFEQTVGQMSELTIQQRMEKFHLAFDRAEIIVAAARIFLHILQSVGASVIEAPSIGVRDGIIVQLSKS